MRKTAKGLIEYAKAQLGKPYWYGTFGQAASKDLYDRHKKQYPNYYKWDYAPEVAGQKVHDCCGLIKGYLFCESPTSGKYTYNENQDISANQMRSLCLTKGTIANMPEVPGLLVFMDGHVGVYIGGGEVIEARGHSYGVVKTKLKNRKWTSWGYCPFVIYEDEKKTVAVEPPVLKKGDKSDAVKAMQILLIGYGFEMENKGKTYSADGSFGGATQNALDRYQSDKHLPATGKCDRGTWAALLGIE